MSTTPISGNSRPGYCNQCGKRLGSSRPGATATKLIESVGDKNIPIFVAHNLGELIAASNRIKEPPHRNRIKQTISAYINQIYGGNITAFAHWVGMHSYTLSSWCKGKAIPQLDNLLQLTSRLEMSLLDFLRAKVTQRNVISRVAFGWNITFYVKA